MSLFLTTFLNSNAFPLKTYSPVSTLLLLAGKNLLLFLFLNATIILPHLREERKRGEENKKSEVQLGFRRDNMIP